MAALFATLALFVIGGVARIVLESRETHARRAANPLPGEEAFRAADKKIIRLKDSPASGNSAQAAELAARFSELIEKGREVAFTEGNKDAFSLSGHRFLVHCQLNKDSCVFLVHVPELRRYKKDAQTSICELAWMIGHMLVQSAGLPPGSQLAVGVKGMINYEAVYIGGITNREAPLEDIKVQNRGLDFAKNRLLFPFFAPATTSGDADGAAQTTQP